MNTEFKSEIKKIIDRVGQAQKKIQSALKDSAWVDDAKKYADNQKDELKKLIKSDVKMVRAFIEKEKKQLEKFQKQIPGEVDKIKKFVDDQKNEFESLLKSLSKRVVKAKIKKDQAKRKSKSAGASKPRAKKTAKKKA